MIAALRVAAFAVVALSLFTFLNCLMLETIDANSNGDGDGFQFERGCDCTVKVLKSYVIW